MKAWVLCSILCFNALHVLARDQLPCPIPANQEESEITCSGFSSCLWENNQCLLRPNDELAYRLNGKIDSLVAETYQIEKKLQYNLYGNDIDVLYVRIFYYDDYHFRIQIDQDGDRRYKVPVPLDLPASTAYPENAEYKIDVTDKQGDVFDFKVTRKSTGAVLFDTSHLSSLIFEDQFLQIATSLPSTYLYGMGENVHTSFRHTFENQTYPIFSRDEFPSDGNKNLYGAHPIYHCIEDDEGNSHAVFFFNSNAMEYSLRELSDGSPGFVFRSIGGILDLHFFLGPKPEDLIKQYTNMIGKPLIPPYWGLGFQLSRWGYENIHNMKAAIERTRGAAIPQDIQYLDIDYFDHKRDFTSDEDAFAGLPDYIREIKEEGIKFVTILDPAIVADNENYPPYQRGKDLDVFVKWPKGEVPEDQPEYAADYMLGKVWPDNMTVFPDFFLDKTHDWWADENKRFHETIEFDGLWIDMNEPSNFGTNEYSLQCKANNLNEPPYPTLNIATGDNPTKTFTSKTICMNGQHTHSSDKGDEPTTYNHYDVHSLYGWSESVATYRANFESTGKRPLVVSRSTYAGSGKYTGHWLGDNTARWVDMRRSIIGMFEFNMFGIPYIGADICGFFGDSDEELCSRWMSMGAFYPFSRNHNAEGFIPQDPGVWKNTAEASRIALGVRYSLLPYLYSLFYEAHIIGGSVIRPLLNEFPADLKARDIDDAFLWGSSLYVAPILESGSTSREVYFPGGVWYDYWTQTEVINEPGSITVEADITSVPLYIRAGSVIPMKEPSDNTQSSRKTPFSLLVAIDERFHTRTGGALFWDDGVTEGAFESRNYCHTWFEWVNGGDMRRLFTSTKITAEGLDDEMFVSKVTVLGFPQKPISVQNYYDLLEFEYDEEKRILSVDLNSKTVTDFDMYITMPEP